MSGAASPTISLLPDNPSAHIAPVQGGGSRTAANLSGNRKPSGWHSTPLIIPVSAASVESMKASPISLRTYKEKWRRTLGPSVPSRHRPRTYEDPYIVIGSLDITSCPTYVVAPLRGDIDAAKDTVFWANDLLKTDARAHIVFMGPHAQGGPRADGDLIEKMLESLVASYPGHAICVDSENHMAGSLDGLVLYAMPHTSKQIVFGFIPDPEEVYSSSVRNLGCLEVETARIPADAKKRHTGERMLTIQFNKAMSAYNRTKQPRPQIIRENRKWNAPPGWVTQISFQTKDGRVEAQDGGADAPAPAAPAAPAPAAPADEVEVILGGKKYAVSGDEKAFENWKQGKFTASEQRLFEETNLKFSNEVYALFLKGLLDSKCKTLTGAETSPDCGVFRYIMSLAYFNKLHEAEGSPLVVGGPEETLPTAPTAPVAAAASVEVKSAPITPVGLDTAAPAPAVVTADAKVAEVPNAEVQMVLKYDGKTANYSVTGEAALVGRNPSSPSTPPANFDKFPKATMIKLNEINTPLGAGVSSLHFGLIKHDGTWYLVNFSQNGTYKDSRSKGKEFQNWSSVNTEDLNTLDGELHGTVKLVLAENISIDLTVKGTDAGAERVEAAKAELAKAPLPVPAPAPAAAAVPVAAPVPVPVPMAAPVLVPTAGETRVAEAKKKAAEVAGSPEVSPKESPKVSPKGSPTPTAGNARVAAATAKKREGNVANNKGTRKKKVTIATSK